MPERIIILLLTITLVIALVSCTDGELTTPQEFLERAQKLTVNNRPIAAILEAKNALQRDGTLLTGRWVLAQNYLKLREGMLAEIELEKLRERGFTHTDFDASYYHALLLQGHYIEIADQAAKLNPTAIDLTFRGEANLGLSDLETDPELRKNREGYVGIAEQYFQRAIKLEPSYVRAHLGLVRVAIWQREYETAAQSLNVAERLAANDISVWNLRGVLNQVTEQFDDAERTYRKAVGLAPYDLLVQINLARILLIQKKGGESAELLDKLIRAHPRMPTLPYLRAVAFLQEGDRESAADQLSGVVAKYPAYLEAAVLLAQILVDLDRLGQAESALFAALENFPADTRAQQLLSRLRAKQASRNTDNESPSTHTTDLIGRAYLSSADGREQRRQRDVARDRKREYIEFTAKSPLEQLDTIDTLLRERNFEKVLKIANLIQSNSPDQPLPYYFMGRAFVAQGDALNARTTFSLALKNDPHYFPAIVNLATIEIDQGNLERAEELFKQAVAIDADSSPAKLGLVRVELARGNYDAADSQIDDVLSRNPNDIAALLAAAEMAHQQEDVARKLGFLKQIVQIAPPSMQARTLMAQTYLEQNEYQHARHVIGEAIDIEPNHPGALLMLSEVQFRNDERQASLITAERLAVRFPKQSDVQRALAIAQIRNDDRAAASDTLKHSLSVNGADVPTLLTLITLEHDAKAYEAVTQLAKRATSLSPNAVVAHRLLGDALLMAKDTKGATGAYENALALSGDDGIADAIYQFSRLNGHDAFVYTLLTNWLAEHPDDAEVAIILGSDEQRQGDTEDAIARFEKVLEQQPDNVTALNDLAWLYHVSGRAGALALAERAYVQNPNNPAIADTLGWILLEHGDASRALELLSQAARQIPHWSCPVSVDGIALGFQAAC